MAVVGDPDFSYWLGLATAHREELEAELDRLRSAMREDLEDAKAACGGDGLGCKTFRPYSSSAERRYRLCGQCPMDALSNVRRALEAGER